MHPLDGSVEVLKEIVEEITNNRRMLVVLVAMVGRGAHTLKTLEHRLSWNHSQMMPVLKRLIAMGLVVKTNKGGYMLVGNPSPQLVHKAIRTIQQDAQPIVVEPQEVKLPAGLEIPYEPRLPDKIPMPPEPAPAPKPTCSPLAARLSAQFKVPAKRAEGEVSMGRVAPCTLCKTPGVLKYGGAPICPKCARL